jgi:hypothetical protein
MNAVLDPALYQALRLLRERLDGYPGAWLVGGSCGLLLQGVAVARPPRDIDIYANAEAAGELHDRLRSFAVEEPAYSETPIYRSTLSHYSVHGCTLELVGGFVVETDGSTYAVNVELLRPYAATVSLESGAIGLMPLGHELLFNLLRGRPDRYEAIAAAIRTEPGAHLPALRMLLERGRWSPSLRSRVRELLKE